MKFLFIDHECHKRTASAKFFLDIVQKEFRVDEHYYSLCYHTASESVVATYDGAIIWEFPISRRNFFFRGKRNVFVPMYDNEWASFWQWKRIAWSSMGVISFCDKVSAHAKRCGVKNILDVRYFPDPAQFSQKKGEAKRVFLWERGDISKDVIEKLFPPELGYTFDVKKSDEFLSQAEYLSRIAECEIVVAPRRKEGIGMSFLEAMAMCKCVVAHNDATMNEYIDDGVNGILFDANAPLAISVDAIDRVRQNLRNSVALMNSNWQKDASEIAKFIKGQKELNPSLVDSLKITLSYPLYLLEGLWYKVKARFKGPCF